MQIRKIRLPVLIGTLISILTVLLFASPASPASAASAAGITSRNIVIRPEAGALAGPMDTLAAASLPKVTISDATVIEGNSGTAIAVFSIKLSKPSSATTSMHLITADGVATLADNDYQAQSVGMTFLAGAVGPALIAIPVTGDQKPETNETFHAILSNPNGVTFSDSLGVGTIANDDKVKIKIASGGTVTEGNSGTGVATFKISLSEPNPGPGTITVHFNTADNTATVADSDYQSQSISITFLSGAIGPSVIAVPVNGDQKPEPNETFFGKLTNATGATIETDSATATIKDNDKVKVSVSGGNVVEGDSGLKALAFKVSLSEPNPGPGSISVHFNTADKTATIANNDYQAQSVTITFLSGAIGPSTIFVSVVGDTTHEKAETFLGLLSSASGMTISQDKATGTIKNDD